MEAGHARKESDYATRRVEVDATCCWVKTMSLKGSNHVRHKNKAKEKKHTKAAARSGTNRFQAAELWFFDMSGSYWCLTKPLSRQQQGDHPESLG